MDLLRALIGEDGKGVVWLVISLILGSGVVSAIVGKLFDRGSKRDERVRDGYAASTAALVAWAEFPYRVARRSADDAETRAALVGRGHDSQEALACRRAWVVGESPVMGEAYAAITRQLRPVVAQATQAAWRRPHADNGAAMVLSDGPTMPPVDVDPFVDKWCTALRYRFGWRRWVFIPPLLRWRLRSHGVIPTRPVAAHGTAASTVTTELNPSA
ncbi:hypothetical protein ACFUC1_08910 [Pedococcus sp. NPDC057267]|uniref:hypothetical protein n=1 Tax=Pedococcus sp. NPDC057267 TaxID=3346077 RepID=UPI003644F4E2